MANDKTQIAWTDATWSPVRGCAPVGEGCRHCYAERAAMRMSNVGGAYEGLVKLTSKGPTWTHQIRFVSELLDVPLRWTKPRKIFVDSMSDLFFEAFTDQQIAAVFGIMAACPQHTFQILTKRPERMRKWFEGARATSEACGVKPQTACFEAARDLMGPLVGKYAERLQTRPGDAWPLPNVWLCVSAWDQDSAAAMVPWLLETPAAVRGVSLEPLLGPVDLRHLDADRAGHPRMNQIDALTGKHTDMGRPCESVHKLDWVIVGGESGPKARSFDVDWARRILADCTATWRPPFMKQVGSRAIEKDFPYRFGSMEITGAGANPKAWEPGLRVQQFPGAPFWKST